MPVLFALWGRTVRRPGGHRSVPAELRQIEYLFRQLGLVRVRPYIGLEVRGGRCDVAKSHELGNLMKLTGKRCQSVVIRLGEGVFPRAVTAVESSAVGASAASDKFRSRADSPPKPAGTSLDSRVIRSSLWRFMVDRVRYRAIDGSKQRRFTYNGFLLSFNVARAVRESRVWFRRSGWACRCGAALILCGSHRLGDRCERSLHGIHATFDTFEFGSKYVPDRLL